MNIEIRKPVIQHPCSTPYGVIDKNFTAIARMNKRDNFTLEYEVEVVTSDAGKNLTTGIFITSLSVVADPGNHLGITSTMLREIPVKSLLEAAIHKAIYPGSRKQQMDRFSNIQSVTAKQKKAAQIILDNPGKPHAQLLMDEFGITEGTARNLKTRISKLGLIPTAQLENELVPFDRMSVEGDYLERVLEGKIKNPFPPSEWFALQETKKAKRKKTPNPRKGK